MVEPADSTSGFERKPYYPKEMWYAGEGQQWLSPIELLAEIYSDDRIDGNFLPHLVEKIETGHGVATLREPTIDPSLPVLWAVIGASGVGKTSLLSQLSDNYPHVSVLHTASSRPARATEAQKPYLDLPAPEEGEQWQDYNARVNIEKYDLVDQAWYAGNIYGLPRAELDQLPTDQIPVVGTAATSLWQLRANLQGRYNVVSVGLVPRTYRELIEVIRSERGASDEQSYRASRVYLDTKAVGREANFAILNPHNTDPDMRAGSVQTAVTTMAQLILSFAERMDESTPSTSLAA